MNQGGIKLTASCTPFDAVSPAVWEAFKKAVMESAKNWGLTVHVSEDLTIQDAKQAFWNAQRVHDDARIKAGE